MRKILVPGLGERNLKMRKIRLPGEVAPSSSSCQSKWWSLHTHSQFSWNDALSPVKELVETAQSHNQPALALTDHGNMGGAVQLYSECKKAGMMPFPGIEAYLKKDVADKKAKRYHIGLVAFTTEGYQSLVKLTSKMHTRQNFHHKPHVDFTDFAEWSQRGWTKGIALTTGCFFGMVQQTLIEDPDKAERLIKALSQWFPHTYVELQHHNIDHEDGVTDDYIVDELYGISQRLGLPLVTTQDAHYCHPEQRPLHDTLKRLVSWGDAGDDAVFPGDGFHLADDQFVMRHYSDVAWDKSIEGLQDLLGKHTLLIPELEKYHYNVPQVTAGDPLEEMRTFCELAMQNMQMASTRYQERYAEELDVVEFTHMAGYLMLVKEATDWLKANGVFFQARGSASGSLICYLLGITQIDPLEWDLRYERFLSKDRTKPPDVDLDVEDDRRDEFLEWLRSRFAVVQIGTYAKYGINAEGGRGSLLVSYISRLRKDGEHAKASSIKSVYDLPKDEQDQLFALAKCKPRKSVGTHAAGVVVASSREEIERLVPTMLIPSSNTTVTMYEMDDVEALGLVKLDALGLKQLRIIRRTVEMLGKSVYDGLGWIPMKDKDTFRMLRRGECDGVFQLEGFTNSRGCQEMKVKSINDIIVVVALYRPATMNTGVKDEYISRRRGFSTPPVRHEILERNLNETHGLPIFQEQVISILRELDFTPEELTEFLKAVKASNENIGEAGKVVARYKDRFEAAAYVVGWTNKDISFAWQAIEGFAEYGFNRAHATTYGLAAYYSAYLRCHHPLEHSAAILEVWAGTQKEAEYIQAVRNRDIRLLKPDVNISGFTWTIDRQNQAIRRGLLSIKGIGEVAAREIADQAPYQDLDDLISRVNARAVTGGKQYHKDGTVNGVLGKLKDAGALKSLGA